VFTQTQTTQKRHIFALAFLDVGFRKVSPMGWKANAVRQRLGMVLPKARNERLSECVNQTADANPQDSGNFHQRIHRGRFLAPFDPIDKDRREAGSRRRFFLTQTNGHFLFLRCTDRLIKT
jgi:hypothetical protein